jgi:hypothetical protein
MKLKEAKAYLAGTGIKEITDVDSLSKVLLDASPGFMTAKMNFSQKSPTECTLRFSASDYEKAFAHWKRVLRDFDMDSNLEYVGPEDGGRKHIFTFKF